MCPIGFDGDDDNLNLGVTSIVPSGPFTINAWINQASSQGLRYIIAEDAPGDANRRFVFGVTTASGYRFFCNTDTDISQEVDIQNIGGSISLNSWGMFTVTYDGTTYRTYANGIAAGTAVGNPIRSATSLSTRIGARDNLLNSFHGMIDELTILNTDLPPNEILDLYDLEIKSMLLQTRPSDDFLLYLPMDDGPDGSSADEDIVKDLSGNGNDAIGDNGPNNTGLEWKAEEVLSYPPSIFPLISVPGIVLPIFSQEGIHSVMFGGQVVQ